MSMQVPQEDGLKYSDAGFCQAAGCTQHPVFRQLPPVFVIGYTHTLNIEHNGARTALTLCRLWSLSSKDVKRRLVGASSLIFALKSHKYRLG